MIQGETTNKVRIKIPPAYRFMVEPHRYKSAYGGRGAARSWTFARLLLAIASSTKKRILCARELQSSIRESVHQLLSSQIEKMGLTDYYEIKRDSIISSCGSEFLFKGIRFNPLEIKSIEDVDICWIEEAQSASDESWEILIPTIRKDGSEIWLSWNTGEESDPTYKRFVLNPPDDCVSKLFTYRDNPYFPEVLEKERRYLQRVDIDAYNHVWEGNPLAISEACIFKGKYVVDEFEAPDGVTLYFGADWGFAQDPTTLIRSFIIDDELFIEYEAYGVGVELDEIPQLFDSVPGSRDWMIKADNSRPETISHISKKNFNITSCQKWPAGTGREGSVKEGIEFLRKFRVIHIHQRCKHMQEEAKLYSYKKDPRSGEVLPIIVDKHNHCWDAVRYGFDSIIRNNGIDWIAFVGG